MVIWITNNNRNINIFVRELIKLCRIRINKLWRMVYEGSTKNIGRWNKNKKIGGSAVSKTKYTKVRVIRVLRVPLKSRRSRDIFAILKIWGFEHFPHYTLCFLSVIFNVHIQSFELYCIIAQNFKYFLKCHSKQPWFC